MGLIVAGVHYLLAGTPDTVLLTVEVLVGMLSYAVLTRREIGRFLRKMLATDRKRDQV